jgi:hypothetical protein
MTINTMMGSKISIYTANQWGSVKHNLLDRLNVVLPSDLQG